MRGMSSEFTDAEWGDLRRTLRFAGECHGLVVRFGIEDACGKAPVAIVDGRGTEDEGFWPACAWHANRYGPCVPIGYLLASMRGAA